MPTIKKNVRVYHRPQKDADPTEVTLASGDSVQVIKEWANRYLIKTSDGKLFNVPKEQVDASG